MIASRTGCSILQNPNETRAAGTMADARNGTPEFSQIAEHPPSTPFQLQRHSAMLDFALSQEVARQMLGLQGIRRRATI